MFGKFRGCMMELSMGFWKKALGVGGVVTVALAMMWSIYGEALDKVSPIGAEASLIILGMMVMFVFLVVGKIIDNKHKEAMKMQESQEKLESKKLEQNKQKAITDGDNSAITLAIEGGSGEQNGETRGKNSPINQTIKGN